MRTLLLIVIYVFVSYTSFAQQDTVNDVGVISVIDRKAGWVFEANGFVGKQIKIYPTYPAYAVSGFAELYAGYQCFGNKSWHTVYNYPQIGVSFMYGYLGNPEVLGNNYSLIPNITFASRDNRKVLVDVRLGTGLSWFDRPYDRLSNPENLIIGSHVTNVTYLTANFRKKITPQFWLWGGASFIHFSNGHYQLPNVGMNHVTLNVGVKVYPYGKPVNRKNALSDPAINKKVLFNVRVGFGVHEFGSATKPLGGPKYPMYVLNAYASKRVGKISNLHAGFFLTYYTGFYDYIVNQNYYSNDRRMKASVLSVFVGHEFMIGRFGLLWQSGINVYNPFQQEYFKMTYGTGNSAKMKTWWCNKIGAQFYLLKPKADQRFNVWLGTYIKSNLMTADFAETALGITF